MTSSITGTKSLIQRTFATQITKTQYHGRTYSKYPFYKGQMKDGLPHGFGVKLYSRDESYTGEWVHGKRHGIGTHLSPRGKDAGSWKEDKRTGWGTTTYEDNSTLTGQWKDNEFLHE